MNTQIEQSRAWHKVGRAIERGILKRPKYCQYCYKNCKTQGHHPDYNKPLEVIWLCPQCHTDEHIIIREEAFNQQVIKSAKNVLCL